MGQLSSILLVWSLKGHFLLLQVLLCDLNPLLISLINHQKWLIDVRYGKVEEGRPTFFLDFMYR